MLPIPVRTIPLKTRAADGADHADAKIPPRREPGQRNKGTRIEREIVARHAELGVKAVRVPLSGTAHYLGNGALS